MKAQVLTVFTRELNEEGSGSSFEVYEFENGLILVPGESTNDWFFANRESIQASGNDVVDSVEESGRFVEFTPSELKTAVERSQAEFGIDSVPSNYLELLWQKELAEVAEYEDGSTRQDWLKAGFTPDTARAWRSVGAFNPDKAMELEQAGVSPGEVSQRVTIEQEQEFELSYSGYSVAYMFCNGDLDIEIVKQLIEQ